MSDLNSEVIGGRSLRNRKSLAAKNKENPPTPVKKEVAFGTSFVSPITRTRSNTVARATRTTRASRRAETTDENEAPVAAISRTKTPARKPRKSSVAKNDVEDGEISMKTPAKTPGRRSTVKKAKSFADVKENEELLAAKTEIADLQAELAQLRKDKMEVEDQLKDALEEPIKIPEAIPEEPMEEAPVTSKMTEEEQEEANKREEARRLAEEQAEAMKEEDLRKAKIIEDMEKEMEQLKTQNERLAAEKIEKEEIFKAEKEKLKSEMDQWKGHFDQIRSTETEELQTQSDDDEDKREELEEVKRQLEEKDRELEDLRKAKQDAEIEKEEKMAKSEALDSALESLRKQLGDVDIARKAAADQAEENKNLARDIQDVYEEKMAKLAKKCEQWRLEADKQNENAKRYREERNKYRNRLEDNEGGLDMIRQAYKEATSRDSCRSDKSAKSDSSKHSNRSHKSPPRDPRERKDRDSRERELEELVITSQFAYNGSNRRIVLAEGEDAPEHAVKAKNSCMPMRVAIEPAPGTNE